MYHPSHGHLVKIFSGKAHHDVEELINRFLENDRNLRLISASTIIDHNSVIKFYTTAIFHNISKKS